MPRTHQRLPQLSARILGTGRWSAGRTVGTEEVLERAMPDRDPARMAARIGIDTRQWAEPQTSVAEMGADALRAALADAGLPASKLERLVVTCSTGGDLLIPGAAVDVAHRLGIGEAEIDAFDLASALVYRA